MEEKKTPVEHTYRKASRAAYNTRLSSGSESGSTSSSSLEAIGAVECSTGISSDITHTITNVFRILLKLIVAMKKASSSRKQDDGVT